MLSRRWPIYTLCTLTHTRVCVVVIVCVCGPSVCLPTKPNLQHREQRVGVALRVGVAS